MLRQLVFLYFFLLLFEGVLRKWIVPGLSTPLAIIRDPVVIAIYLLAIQRRIFPLNFFLLSLALIMGAALAVALLPERNTLFIAAYGARTNFLHFPLIFVLPGILRYDDVIRIGRWCLWSTIPLAPIMVFQLYSPVDAWINTTAGGVGEQITGAGGVRPPGYFTFITGVAEFLALATAFFLYGALFDRRTPVWLAIAALVCIVVAASVSVSRLTLLSVALVVGGLYISALARPGTFGHALMGLIFGSIVALGVMQTDFVQEGISTTMERIEVAAQHEGGSTGFINRVLGLFQEPITRARQTEIFGQGLGMGTNAAAYLRTGSKTESLAEGDLDRIIFESGPLVGGAYVIWRFALAGMLGWQSFRLISGGYFLPWLLFCACGPLVLIGQLGRPTTLGFTVFGAALCYTAIVWANRDLRERHQKKLEQMAQAKGRKPARYLPNPSLRSTPRHG